MKEIDDIRQAFRHFMTQPGVIESAEVIDVDEQTDTVTVKLDTGLELDDVRLRSIIKDGSKWVLVPSIGSIVLIGRIDDTEEFVVVAVEDVSRIIAVVGSTRMELDKDGFLIRRGTDDLLKILKDLVDANLNELHNTAGGPTTGMMPSSAAVYTSLKTRLESLLKTV
jgi:hypothetical protein